MNAFDRALLVLVVLGAAVCGWGFWTAGEVRIAYRVEFSEAGQGCAGNALTLDEHDGEPLACNFRETGTKPYTDEERSELVGLAGDLGKDGLSDADRARILSRNAEIARRHGDPGIREHRMVRAGEFAVMGGAGLAVLFFFWWVERMGRR